MDPPAARTSKPFIHSELPYYFTGRGVLLVEVLIGITLLTLLDNCNIGMSTTLLSELPIVHLSFSRGVGEFGTIIFNGLFYLMVFKNMFTLEMFNAELPFDHFVVEECEYFYC